MSDHGYDNVELNELINDLKNVGHHNSSHNNQKITKTSFQHSSAESSRRHRVDGIPSYNNNNNYNNKELLSPTYNCKVQTMTARPDFLSNSKPEPAKNVSQNNINRVDVDNLQKELALVKNELALLKRSHSLANHPIFGESVSENRNVTREIIKTETPLTPSLYRYSKEKEVDDSRNPVTPKLLRNNFSSVSNVSYVLPNSNNFQYQSLSRLNSSSYSAHRENMEKLKLNSNTYSSKNVIPTYTESYYDETEDCSLQPIGKGIQTLTGSETLMSKSNTYFDNKVPEQINSPTTSYYDSMKSVKLMKSSWLKLDASREECKSILAEKEAGSFIIRIQSDYKIQSSGGMMFELILKVANQNIYNTYYDDNFEYFSIKEFTESIVRGFKLIGHAIEPMFPSLDSFVLQHLEIPLGLPCCLKLCATSNVDSSYKNNKYFNKPKLSLPFNIISKKLSGSLTSLSSMKSQVTVCTYAQPAQAKMNAELLFLGKVTVDRLSGMNAIRHAVDKILLNGYQPKHCIEINAYFDSLAGISIVDNERILFFKKFVSATCIIGCDVDPLHRGLNSEFLNAKGIKNAKIFGVLYQKRKILIKENKVIVFAEFNPATPMEIILKFVKSHLIKRNIF